MKKQSLSFKIWCVVGIFVLALGIVAIRSMKGLGELHDHVDRLAHFSGRAGGWVKLRDTERQLIIQEREYFVAKDSASKKEIAANLDNLKKDVDKQADDALAKASDFGKEKGAEFKKHIADFWIVHMKCRELVDQGKVDEALQLAEREGVAPRRGALKALDEVVDFNNGRIEAAVVEAGEEYKSTRAIMWLLIGGATALGCVFSWFVIRQVSAAIGRVIGDLTENSNQVGSAATQISSSSVSLSQSATEQAASLEQTAASIEEMTSMVQRNLESSQRASELSSQSQSTAERGKAVVREMTNAINDIDSSNTAIMQQIDESNRQMAEVTRVIAEIGNKTKVINDIVFQTKLLSFNASVEAARAGEHGKGFAVVAEEVGNLAQMSGNAAKEISSMLEESIKKVESAVNESRQKVDVLIRAGKDKVETGTRVAGECSAVLEEIVSSVSQVTQMSTSIASASEEQAQGIREISKAMHQLDQVTQTNAAASEQAANAAEELSAQAQSMKAVVGDLVRAVRGENGQDNGYYGSESAPRKSVAHGSAKTFSFADAARKKEQAVKSPSTSHSSNPSTKAKTVAAKSAQMAPMSVASSAQPADSAPVKLASGSDLTPPSESDPRFRDI